MKRPDWWPVRLTRYRPTSLEFVLSAAFVPVGPVIAVASLSQQRTMMPDAVRAVATSVFATFGLCWAVHYALLAWRVEVTVHPDNVTVVRYWVQRTVPRSEIRSLVITRQGQRLLASFHTSVGDRLVWARYLGRHRHRWQALTSRAACQSCEQEWTTLQGLALDLGVAVEIR